MLERLYRAILLPAFALLLLLTMWMAVAYQVGQERATARKEAVSASQALASTLADHTSYILRQADHASQLFKLQYEETGGKLRLDEFTRRNGLLDSVLPSRLDLPLALIAADGRLLDSANSYLPGTPAEQAYFKTHAEDPSDTALFGTPVLQPGTKKWLIRISRRLNDKGGRFAGVIVMMIDPSYFIDDYDRLNLDDSGALLLLTRDSGLSIGRVGERLIISDKIAFQASDRPGHPPDELLLRQPFDAVARIYSLRDLPRYPLLAVVGVTREAALANFERRRRMYFGAAALASLFIVGVVGLLMRQSRRLRASMGAAREAQAMLRAAAQGSLDAVIMLKAWRPAGRARRVEDFIFVDLNERATEMLGKPRADLLGQRALQLLPLFRQAIFFDKFRQVLETGRTMEEEFELPLASGRTRWLRHQIVAIEDGVAVTTRDISARKLAELDMRDKRGFLQSLIEHLPVLVYVKSARPENFGQMVVWNKAAERVTGYAAACVIGKNDALAFPADYPLSRAADDRRLLAGGAALDLPDQPFLRPDGTLRYLHTVAVLLFDERGQAEYILGIAEDVSSRRLQEQALRENQAELAAVNDASPLGLVRLNQARLCTYVNRTFESITGLSRKQAQDGGWTDAVHPDDRPALMAALDKLGRTRQPFQATLRCLHGDGRLAWLSLKVAAILIDGAIEGYVGSVDDITVLRLSEVALLESEARLRTIADALPAMIAYLDAGQVYRFHNLAYEREFKLSGLQVLGETVRATVGAARYAALEPYIERVLAGETVSFEEEDNNDGIERCLEVIYIPQRGEDGVHVVGFHVMRQDITMQKREKRRLLQLAQVDALTGLSNRAGFLQKLSDAMHYCHEHHSLMAVMYMDIDRFKPVNDTHGHSVGDALLKAFSNRLAHAVRASDVVARLGGDEFTIVMEKIVRPEDASVLAAKIVLAMQAPFELDDITVDISASLGVAFYRDEEITPAALLKRADVLLYEAKQAGRNTYRAGALPASA